MSNLDALDWEDYDPPLNYKWYIDQSIILPPKPKPIRVKEPYYYVIHDSEHLIITVNCDVCESSVKVKFKDTAGIALAIIEHNREHHDNQPYTVNTKRI